MSQGIAAPRLAGAVPWPDEFAEQYRASGLWQGQSIGAWFSERASLFAARTAVVDGTRRVTYGELEQRVCSLSAAFAGLGLEPLDRVVLQLPNSLELVETLLALIRLGVVPVLALPPHRRVELTAFCVRAGAVALILAARHGTTDMRPIAAAVVAQSKTVRHVLVHGGNANSHGFVDLAALSERCNPAAVDDAPQVAASEVALLQLSGGSTGTPKLIPRTHDDYLYSVRASADLCGLSADTRYLSVLPMTHNFALSSPGVLGTLHAGGSVVMCPHPSPGVVFRLIADEAITLTAAVPSLVRTWVDAKLRGLATPNLENLTLQVGGAKLDEGLAHSVRGVLGCQLQQVFGMAEGLVNYTRRDAPDDVVATTQGRPLSTFDETRVVDPADPEGPSLPRGSVGELQTRGPYTIRGYFDYREHNARHFTQDGFYRTGDLVRLTEPGDLIVEGRLGERILRAGEKVAPQEIEEHLLAHPQIRDAAVVGVPDSYLGQRSHAFVVLADAQTTTGPAALRDYLRERGLADFKLPDAFHIIESLPRTSVGKTDKNALRQHVQTT